MFGMLHAGQLELLRLNFGGIILLTKVNEAERVQQYMHVCLLNISFKIFTKVPTRSEPSSTVYGSECTTQAPRIKSSLMRSWVLIIYLKKLAVGVSPTAFLSKKSAHH
jgi:hypothetical protein